MISVGRIVHIRLTSAQATAVNRRRTSGEDIAARYESGKWPIGAQAHVGTPVSEGDMFPILVTAVPEPGIINGQIFLDGNDTLWIRNVAEGSPNEIGTWFWPEKVTQ